MIAKEREFPIIIQQLEVLLQRLDTNHPKKREIEKELSIRWSGHRGELNLDYHLHFLPKKEYTILRNLRITNDGKYYFQMDTLLLHENYILIVETKNIKGKLTFEGKHNQLIRNIGDQDEGFQDPITQVRQQQFQLSTFLLKNQLSNIPIDYLIVVSNDTSIIQTQFISSYNKFRIIHAPILKERVESIETLYKTQIMTPKTIKKLAKLLIKAHTPLKTEILHKFDLSKRDIITGVKCPNCRSIPMKRGHGTWICKTCGTLDKKAHIDSLNDYFLLIGPSITNQHARKFLHLSSKDTTSRLLKGMNLLEKGTRKDKKYFSLYK
ncbi:NERD domain-containing protein [Bacillus massilinigeriensis]|uniref:NERD domain-containing protein n=1 Tax=Bacillus massilionigeriensis TaxID=1805475 RepID=UPI00096B416B|nr:NERD domain-containing protein [Bacillus massilionigeriensis]